MVFCPALAREGAVWLGLHIGVCSAVNNLLSGILQRYSPFRRPEEEEKALELNEDLPYWGSPLNTDPTRGMSRSASLLSWVSSPLRSSATQTKTYCPPEMLPTWQVGSFSQFSLRFLPLEAFPTVTGISGMLIFGNTGMFCL